MFGQIALVAVGGAAGSVTRYLVNVGSMKMLGPNLPAGTLIVNVVGSFLMGVFIEMLALRWNGSAALRSFVATGFLGGFTTFSSFSLDFAVLWERGAAAPALAYAFASVVLSLAAIFAGLAIVRAIT